MDEDEANRLLEALAEAGWVSRERWIYAPRGTMWLNRVRPWHEGLRALLERMTGRLNSLRQQRGFDDAIADTQSLVDVVERLCTKRN